MWEKKNLPRILNGSAAVEIYIKSSIWLRFHLNNNSYRWKYQCMNLMFLFISRGCFENMKHLFWLLLKPKQSKTECDWCSFDVAWEFSLQQYLTIQQMLSNESLLLTDNFELTYFVSLSPDWIQHAAAIIHVPRSKRFEIVVWWIKLNNFFRKQILKLNLIWAIKCIESKWIHWAYCNFSLFEHCIRKKSLVKQCTESKEFQWKFLLRLFFTFNDYFSTWMLLF